ncbi:MAG: T9SS type A sorting domain-containing protein, partial [Paludibacteraceae bacterium]|nr:T9SS type A sorting domain-containing protein [Paludibacteraceae bacterium]
LRREVSSLSGLTSEYFQYVVTASNNETRKTYKVFIDCPQSTSGCFGDNVDVSVLMNKQDQTIEILEIQSGECTVPISGNGSTRTLHYLTKEDKPLNGVYEISGPRVVCIGSIAEYAISNAAESNGAQYHWVISRAPGTTEKESFTVINGVKDTVYSAADPNVIEEIRQIYDGETMLLQAPNSLTNAQIALKIIIDLEYTDKQCALLSGQANAEIYATKLPPTQVTEVSAGCVGDDGRLKIQATQSVFSDEYNLPIDATTYTWNFSPSELNSKYTEVLGDPSTIYVDLGEDVPDIHVIVGVQNGCGVGPNSNDLYVDYAAHQTEWLGTVSSEWHNNRNWTHHVPAACTDVIIRDVTSSNDAAPDATEEFYEKSGYYPEIEDGRTGECKNITFRPGAGVKGLDRLSYKRAFVQVDLQRNNYYTLTAPLGDMYSGDYYFGGMPEMEIRFFKEELPDSKRATGNVSEGWTQPFQTLDAELYGKGFLYRVSDTVWNYPNGMLKQNSSKVITFPRMNTDSSLVTTVYPHSSFTGKLFTKIPVKLDKTEQAYRFAAEAGTGSLPSQFSIYTEENGLLLVPNPLMTHLDVAKFLEDNSAVVEQSAKFWNGKNFNSFMAASDMWNSPTEGNYLSSRLMPPMQAFLVEVISGGDELVYDYNNHFVRDDEGSYDLRADKKKDVMYVQTSNSSASIAKRDGKNNGYNKSEDSFKLFPVIADDKPNVYTLTGGVAVDINQFGQYPFVAPIGISTNKEEPTNVTLAFKGAESFSDVDVILVNNLTGEEVNLKDESTYTLSVANGVDNSTLQIEFRNSVENISTDANNAAAEESGIQIFVENGNTIRVLCSSDNKINSVEIFSLTGRTITKQDNINTSHFNLTLNSGASTVTVRATTEKGVKIEKVLIR